MSNKAENKQNKGGAKGNDQTKESGVGQGKAKPPIKVTGEPLNKGPKRTHSDVSEASAEELTIIHQQLDMLTQDLKETKDSVRNLMSKNDIQDFIERTVECVVKRMEEKFTKLIDVKVRERTLELTDRIKALEFDNQTLKDRLEKCENDLKTLDEKASSSENLAIASIQKSNYNEQYSRKNNFKIMEIPENQNETEQILTETVCSLLLSKGNVDLDPSDIVAIHRIPGRPRCIKPVLIKLKNNSTKVKVMQQRSLMKVAGHRLVDDVTKLNTGLISRLLLHQEITSAWYFNGSVYGRTTTGIKLKFEIYSSIDETIRKKKDNERR